MVGTGRSFFFGLSAAAPPPGADAASLAGEATVAAAAFEGDAYQAHLSGTVDRLDEEFMRQHGRKNAACLRTLEARTNCVCRRPKVRRRTCLGLVLLTRGNPLFSFESAGARRRA